MTTFNQGETLRRIDLNLQEIFDSGGNFIGFVNPVSGGDDFRPVRFTQDGTALVGMGGVAIPIGGTPCEAYGASPSATAAVNTAAIKAALNNGGRVTLLTPGEYLINATLVIGDNTQFVRGAGVSVRLAPGSNCNMLVNSAYLATPSAVTLTWSAGNTMSIAWTGHGLLRGQYVSVTGAASANQQAYTGVFPITTVTDANHIVVTLQETPAAAPASSGAATVRKANFNIDIEGGLWNYDSANQTTADGKSLHCVILAHVARFSANRQRYSTVPKYCLLVAAVRDYECLHHHAMDGSQAIKCGDIIKVSGPSFNGDTGFISGICGDDIFSIQTQESAPYIQYEAAGGSVIGHRIHNVSGISVYNGHSATAYLPPNGTPWTMTGIEFDCADISANSAAPPIVVAGDSTAGNYGSAAGTLTFKNMNVNMPAGGFLLDVDQYCYVKVLSLDSFNIDTSGETTAYDTIRIQGKVDVLNYAKMYGKSVQSMLTSNATTLIDVVNIRESTFLDVVGVIAPNGGTIKTINLYGCDLTSSGAGRNFLYPLAATVIKEVNLFGCNTGSACAVLDTGSAALAGIKINLYGGYFNGYKTVAIAGHQAKIYAAGCVFDCPVQGVLRTDGTAVVSLFSGGGNTFLNSTDLTAGVGSGTCALSLFGWDLPYDVITGVASVTLASTAGQYLNSTRAGATNLGPAVKAPAGWVALGTGALGVNTVIS